MRTLDSITFDASNFTFHSDEDGVRIWYTAVGDGIGLYYFPLPPDIGADLKSIEDVRAALRKLTTASGGAIIEVETPLIDGCDALRTIIKVPQQSHGMTYLGSIILPFRDFNYVVKVQCKERGITGLRESEILSEMLDTGEVRIDLDGEGSQIVGWAQDPYDASFVAPLMRNRAEAEDYDARFPKHPLSRLRPVLNHIQNTLKVADEIKVEPSFEYGRTQSKRPRWKIW
jgi:hypothetical protein